MREQLLEIGVALFVFPGSTFLLTWVLVACGWVTW